MPEVFRHQSHPFAVAALFLCLLSAKAQTPGPKLSDFVLYAERSIQMREGSHTEHGGDVGVRTVLFAGREGPAQLQLAGHAKCGDAFSPSTSLEHDAKIHKLFTDSLRRVTDTKVGAQEKFPAPGMPPLPLASASGTGENVTVEEHKSLSLTPGSYGALTLEGHSALHLSAGAYTFASIKMGEHSRLLGERTGRDDTRIQGLYVGIVNGLQMGDEARIQPAWDDAKAKDFIISVAGSDPAAIVDPASAPPTVRLTPTTVVSLAHEAHIHALLAAPHGTIWMAERAGGKGAFAAFDIVLGGHVEVEFESGFSSLPGQQGSQQLNGYFAVEDPSIAPLADPVPAGTLVPLSIGLPVRDPAGLQTLLQQIADPKSPNYRKHLSQPQFYSTFGATAADYQSLQNWAKNGGFTINATYPSNLLLAVTATAAQIEQAFHTNLVYRRRQDGSTFVTVDRNPSLDLATPILHVSGFNDFILPRHNAVNGTGFCPPPNSNVTCGRSYRAADLRNAYLGVGSSCQKLDGTGQVVGIVDFNTFTNSDISSYFALQSPPLTPAFFPSIVATEGGNPGANSALEATLDVELVQAMAPNARILLFQGSSGLTGHLDDILHAMATSNPPLTVVSCSLGFGRSDNSQQALDEMGAQGVSILTASGDFGDIGDPQGNLDMGSQTLVGGTILNTNALSPNPSTLTPPFPASIYPSSPAKYYAGENTWNLKQPPHSQDVTGGGIMDGNNKGGGNIFNVPPQGCYCWPQTVCCGSGVPLPDYQKGTSMSLNGGSGQFRNYPDVSMLAANPEIIFQGNATTPIGTSLAAPLWAGFMALVDQNSLNNGVPLAGFLNTTLYDIGLTSGQPTDLYKISFNDINDGGNNSNGFGPGFTTVQGYDLTTGLGSPTCGLLNQLSTITPLNNNQPVDLIGFTFSTGHDNLRGNGGFLSGCGGTGLTGTVLLKDGTSFPLPHPLKPTGTDESWEENTTTSRIDMAIPNTVTLTPANGIQGVTLAIHEQFSSPCGPDNWDVTALNVTIFNPPSPPDPSSCQLNITPNPGDPLLQDGHPGIIRFSNSPGSSGSGQTATFLVTDPRNKCP
jgi:hypothetical protein